MTKIALTTKYSAYNFGAMLQTYALQKTIKKLGAECLVVDADRKRQNELMPWRSPRQIVQNLMFLFHKKELQIGYKRFEEFIDTFSLSESYKSYDELKRNPPEADVYLAGSDQIWNPLDVQENYFLRYVPSDRIRASYAASMGISYMPEGAKRIWNEYLRDIDYISVREVTAKKLINEIAGRDSYVHVDPVLLLSPEEWDSEAVMPNFDRSYIFCYVLYRPNWLNLWLKKLHKETGKEIVVISSDAYRNIYHTKMVRDAGPCEMLGWLQNADFVISSSFHGVALSVANRKPFYAVLNPDAPARITDLLVKFDLENRIIDRNHGFELMPIDYARACEIQAKEQMHSLQYLQFLIDRPEKASRTEVKKEKVIGTIASVGNKCTGCSVCAYICPTKAITMQVNDEGFQYPVIDNEICVKCSKCLRFCHTL